MNYLKNIQFQQLINLLLLLSIANSNNSLQTNWITILILSIFAATIELALVNLNSKINRNSYILYIPFSAIITLLGIVLMIGYIQWYIPFVLLAISLAQKQFLTIDKKHIFNPSNFAVIAALTLFYPKALPIIGQLGHQGYTVIAVTIMLAIFILLRVNRLTIPIIFSFFYIALEWLIIGHSNPNWEFTHFLTKFYTTSFIVYLFFMLTDPITTPNSIKKQALFSVLIATILVTLDYVYTQRVWNLFLALFLSSALFVPAYRELEKVEWIKYALIVAVSIILTISISNNTPHYFNM